MAFDLLCYVVCSLVLRSFHFPNEFSLGTHRGCVGITRRGYTYNPEERFLLVLS